MAIIGEENILENDHNVYNRTHFDTNNLKSDIFPNVLIYHLLNPSLMPF